MFTKAGYIMSWLEGFRNRNKLKRFAKLLTYATIYHSEGDWEQEVLTETKQYCSSAIRKMGIKDGWQEKGSYDSLKRWFLETH